MKRITIPKECYPEDRIPENRTLRVGMKIVYTFEKKLSPITIEKSDWFFTGPGNTHRIHISRVSCGHPSFRAKRCICVTIKNGVITNLDWHFPHQGDHR